MRVPTWGAVVGLVLLGGLALLALVGAGAGHLVAQAVAILFVTPFSFAANKLWAFAGDAVSQAAGEPRPALVLADRRP